LAFPIPAITRDLGDFGDSFAFSGLTIYPSRELFKDSSAYA
jgi:hypothetical protein